MKRNKSLIGFLMVCLVVMSSFLIDFQSNAAGYVVNSSSIELTAIVHGQKGYCTAFELISDGNAYLLSSTQIANTVTFTSGYSGRIVAISVYGNYGTLSTPFGNYIPQVSVVWNEDSRSYSQLAQIVSTLNTLNINLGGKLDTLVSRVNALISEVDNVEEILVSINNLVLEYYPKFESELQNIVNRLDTLIEQSASDKNATDKFASDSK